MAADVNVTAAGEIKIGSSHELFKGLQNAPPHNFDVDRDGRRFLVILTSSGLGAAGVIEPMVVVLNWLSVIDQ